MRLRFGDFVLDLDARQLFSGTEENRLRPKTFDLLRLLALARPRALSKAEIHRYLWPETAVEDVSLTAVAADLRAILGDDARRPRYVRTARRFIGEAETPVVAPVLLPDNIVFRLARILLLYRSAPETRTCSSSPGPAGSGSRRSPEAAPQPGRRTGNP